MLSTLLGCRVSNFGVSGYNAYLESALFADVGPAYEPDLVLVQFCVNDLNDPTLHFEPQTRSHLPSIPDEAYPDPRLRQRLTPAAPIWLAACRGLRVCQTIDRALFAWRVGRPDADALRAMLEPHGDLSDPVVRAWLARRYGELARSVRTAGARFAVIALPHARQLAGSGAELQRDLVLLGDVGGWITLDLLPAFVETSRTTSAPLFDDEWHPNVLGHRVAAEATLAGLERFGLLPSYQSTAQSNTPAPVSVDSR